MDINGYACIAEPGLFKRFRLDYGFAIVIACVAHTKSMENILQKFSCATNEPAAEQIVLAI